jgi:hypothetical protein
VAIEERFVSARADAFTGMNSMKRRRLASLRMTRALGSDDGWIDGWVSA